jgi:hypothetical protein
MHVRKLTQRSFPYSDQSEAARASSFGCKQVGVHRQTVLFSPQDEISLLCADRILSLVQMLRSCFWSAELLCGPDAETILLQSKVRGFSCTLQAKIMFRSTVLVFPLLHIPRPLLPPHNKSFLVHRPRPFPVLWPQLFFTAQPQTISSCSVGHLPGGGAGVQAGHDREGTCPHGGRPAQLPQEGGPVERVSGPGRLLHFATNVYTPGFAIDDNKTTWAFA